MICIQDMFEMAFKERMNDFNMIGGSSLDISKSGFWKCFIQIQNDDKLICKYIQWLHCIGKEDYWLLNDAI